MTPMCKSVDLGCWISMIMSAVRSRRIVLAISLILITLEPKVLSEDLSSIAKGYSASSSEQLCADCRLASRSVEELLRSRRKSTFSQEEEEPTSSAAPVDLEKLKKAVCKDIASDDERTRCRQFYFTRDDSIRRWQLQLPRVSFFDYVCIKDNKYCCPRNSFGPKCAKCVECAQNEHCHGEGTRSGNGTCVCREGHTGPKCTACLRGFYKEQATRVDERRVDKSGVCVPCHRSCESCRAKGPLACEVCRAGFTWVTAYGCSDVDECLESDRKVCGDNTFCVNTEGSYFCYECDRACNGCHGDGPDMCLKCAKNYHMQDNNCVADEKVIVPAEANYFRYAMYTGMVICTCIVLHDSVILASLIGLAVALYIGFAEYIVITQIDVLNDRNSIMQYFSGWLGKPH